jgi:hypothetical protein
MPCAYNAGELSVHQQQVGFVLEKYRLCTTISMKHWEILKKHVETHQTQQKVLEHALDILDTSNQPGKVRSKEVTSHLAMNEKSAGPVQKYALMMLLDNIDLEKIREYITRVKPTVYALEYYYHKPLSECSLKEIMDGLVVTTRAIGWYDTVDYADDGDRYVLKLTHSMGLNGSKVAGMVNEVMFNTYGARIKTVISEKGVVHTLYKTAQES